MSRLDELRARRALLDSKYEKTISNMKDIAHESIRVANVAHNSDRIMKNLDEEFEAQTKLRGKDIGFLFFATALQCIRQYFLTDFKERI